MTDKKRCRSCGDYFEEKDRFDSIETLRGGRYLGEGWLRLDIIMCHSCYHAGKDVDWNPSDILLKDGQYLDKL